MAKIWLVFSIMFIIGQPNFFGCAPYKPPSACSTALIMQIKQSQSAELPS